MKLTIKTTQQKVFQIDVEPSDTVAVLKSKIQESQSHPVGVQKIIYSGKILTDDKTIESCGIKEKDFLVLMVSKPKPTPTPAATTPAAPAPAAPAAVPEPVPSAPASAPAPAPAPVSLAPPTNPAFGDMSSFVSGAALQETINNMIEMGFPRDQVQRALRASFNNPDRAVEYLMTGIPAHLEAEAAGAGAGAASGGTGTAGQPTTASTTTTTPPVSAATVPAGQPQNLFQLAQQQQQPGTGTATTAGGPPATLAGSGGQHLDINALRNSPQIQQLRAAIASNPENAQALIQQLAAQNPVVAQTIAANPQVLMELLGVQVEGAEGDIPPGAQVVNVTAEERAAIERLEALGFTRHAVLEAYFACDKNEELAANYLFENGFED
ncbi:hypothetical protein BDZ94DRAFT_1168021 [Collybia nuda]|uniref:UV excision repair protein RAD23 n=1 Tax=Collybia nuda TaxID=64659 RepID=A0A9P6CHW9_9AGAR|nr:hypothetical protein BDZ94DRAFT_1168021 [Collybia nuda]